MNICGSRDLGQMGNTDDLTPLSDQPQLLPDFSRGDPGDPGPYLAKDQGRRILIVSEDSLDRQHNAGQLAA